MSNKLNCILKAKQLYNLYLLDKDFENISDQVHYNEAIFLERQSLRVSKYLVKLYDQWIPVVFDKKRKTPITILDINRINKANMIPIYLNDRILSKSKSCASGILTNKLLCRNLRGVVSIGDPNTTKPDGYDELEIPKLRLEFHDITYDAQGYTEPKYKDVEKLIEFGNKLFKSFKDKQYILVHCQAGVGRSTASAYVLRCIMMGVGKEMEAMKLLSEENKFLMPNHLIIDLADEVLGRKGKMSSAIRQTPLPFGYGTEYDYSMA